MSTLRTSLPSFRTATTTGPAPAATASSPAITLAVVSAAVFMATLDIFIVNIAFPDIRRDFAGTSLSGLSWVLNGYAIVFAALLVPAGRLADRIGQKRGFLAGLALFTVASALCATAGGPVLLVAARLLQATGAAALMPTSLALLLHAFPAERRPWAIGMWTAVSGMAAAAGPVIGGLLVELSWRWVFLVNLPVGIVAGVLAVRVLSEHRDETDGRRPDLVGAFLLTGGIATLALGLVEGPDWGWTSARVVGSLAGAVLLIAGFAWRSGHHPSPIVEPALLRVRSFSVATIAALLFNLAFSAMLLSLVEFMTGVWNYSSLRTGLAISPGPLAVPFVAVLGPRLARRWGATRIAIAGTLLFGLANAFWALRVGAEPAYVSEMLPGLIAGGIGFALALPMLLTTASRSLPPQRFATGSAVVTMARQIGTVLGVAFLIVILDGAAGDAVGTFHTSWIVVAVSSAAAAVACLFLSARGSNPPRTNAA